MDPSEVPWRDTMRPVRFYTIDARSAGSADGVVVRAGLVDDGGRLAGDSGVPHRRGARLPFPGRAPGAPRRKRRPPPRPSRGAVAALCGFWLMAGLALMPSAASAEFRYVAPSAARAGVTVLDEARRPRRAQWRNARPNPETPGAALAPPALRPPGRCRQGGHGRVSRLAEPAVRRRARGGSPRRRTPYPPGRFAAGCGRARCRRSRPWRVARRSRRHPAGRAGALGCAGRSRSAVSHRPPLPPAPRPGVRRRLHRRRAGAVLRAFPSAAPARRGIHRRRPLPRGDPSRTANDPQTGGKP